MANTINRKQKEPETDALFVLPPARIPRVAKGYVGRDDDDDDDDDDQVALALCTEPLEYLVKFAFSQSRDVLGFRVA